MTDDPQAPLADMDDRQQGGIQVIARMGRIMRALSAHTPSNGMSLAAIASEVDLPRSTVQRIINALVAENIVEPAGPTGFRIGPALARLIYHTHADIAPVLKPYVEKLSLKLQETVCLVRLQGSQLQVIETVMGEQVLRVVPQAGIIPPLHITAAGKALLALNAPDTLRDWISTHAPDFNEAATRRLLAEIDGVREHGYATDFDEVLDGVCAMAVSISTYRGAYALMVLAPSVRMHKQLPYYRDELLELREQLHKLLDKQGGTA